MKTKKIGYSLVIAALAFGGLAALGGASGIEPVDRKPHAELIAALKSGGQERIAQGMQTLFDADPASGKLSPRTSPLMVTLRKSDREWTLSALDDEKLGSTLLIGSGFQEGADRSPRSMTSFDRAKASAVIQRLKACGAAYYPDTAQGIIKAGFERRYSGDTNFILRSALETARARRQREIDANMVKIDLGSGEMEIAQGDLRRLLEKRIQSLKEERARLPSSGDKAGLAKNEALMKKYEGQVGKKSENQTFDAAALKPAFADIFVKGDGQFIALAVDISGACVIVASGDDFSHKAIAGK